MDEGEGEAPAEEEEQGVSEEAKGRTRKVIERALKSMRERKAERVTLLNACLAFEREQGSAEDVEKVEKSRKRRLIEE